MSKNTAKPVIESNDWMQSSFSVPYSHDKDADGALIGRLEQECTHLRELCTKVEKDEKGNEVSKVVQMTSKEVVAKYWPKVRKVIMLCNEIGEFDTILFDRSFDNIMIPKEFAHLIIPLTVRYDSSNREFNDILVKGSGHKDDYSRDSLTYAEYLDALRKLREAANMRVADGDGMVSLSSLKTNLSLSEVFETFSYNGICHYRERKYLPLRINADLIPLVGDRWLNLGDMSMIAYFYTDWSMNGGVKVG